MFQVRVLKRQTDKKNRRGDRIEMLEMMENTGAMLFLAGGAWTDLKTKTISHGWLLLFTTAGILLRCAGMAAGTGAGSLPAGTAMAAAAPRTIPALLTAFLPGAALLLLNLVMRDQIGRGDGLTLLVLGLYLPARRVVAILVGAFFLAGTAAAVLLILRRAGMRTRLPFLPFLAAAAAASMFFGG